MNIESRWATNEENKPIALCTTASSVFLEDGTSLENYLKTIGSEGGNGFYIEKLLDGNMTEVGEYDLLNNIDNYDMIVVTADVVLSDSHEQLASLVIMKEDYYYQGAENCGHAINSSINGSTRRIIFYFSSGSKINIVLNEKLALKKIYGVKLSSSSGGGGSSSLVIPDYSNLITTVNGNSYTATQNCYVEVYIEASDGREDKYIVNGVMLGRCGASAGIYQGTKGIFLKENDVLNTRQDVNHTIVMNVFGLQAISM